MLKSILLMILGISILKNCSIDNTQYIQVKTIILMMLSISMLKNILLMMLKISMLKNSFNDTH